MKRVIVCFLLVIFFLTGCADASSNSSSVSGSKSVNYVKAKELIINNGAIMVDVRTKEEYDDNHIEGAVSLPLDDINEETVKKIVKNKDDAMIVYCKSGVRSAKALEELNNLGYNNVYDLGSINNWKE